VRHQSCSLITCPNLMGNECVCLARGEDTNGEYAKRYNTYCKLWDYVNTRLNNDSLLHRDCIRYYQEECTVRRLPHLNKQICLEIVTGFITRLSCNDLATIQRIGMAVDQICTDPVCVTHEQYILCLRTTLIVAEHTLRERITSMKEASGDSAQPEASARAFSEQVRHTSNGAPTGSWHSVPSLSGTSVPVDPPYNADARRVPSPAQHRPPQLPDQQRAPVLLPSSPSMGMQKTMDTRSGGQMGTPNYSADIAYNDGFKPVMSDDLNRGGSSPAMRAQGVGELNDGMQQRYPSPEVEEMMNTILVGKLPVRVFNNQKALEPKRLCLNLNTKKISILRHDGRADASWESQGLQYITRGITASIVSDPPPADQAISFCFCFGEDPTEDRFLCVVFDSADDCYLATMAFSHLCSVPVVAAT